MKKINTFYLLFLSAISFSAYGQLTETKYTDGKQELKGIAGKPESPHARKAGILILPAWKGIDENSKATAEKLSAEGYYTFVADIYGTGKYPKDTKEAAAISSYYKEHPDEYRQRIKLALEQLVKAGADPKEIVVIGYCFGGTGALEAARANMPVKGVVSFHGGLGYDPARTISPIKTKVLVLHGADDPFVPEAQIKAFQDEMRQAKADWEMVYFANAVHAFTEKSAGNDNSKGAAYNELAAKRSWAIFGLFLDEVFQ